MFITYRFVNEETVQEPHASLEEHFNARMSRVFAEFIARDQISQNTIDLVDLYRSENPLNSSLNSQEVDLNSHKLCMDDVEFSDLQLEIDTKLQSSLSAATTPTIDHSSIDFSQYELIYKERTAV